MEGRFLILLAVMSLFGMPVAQAWDCNNAYRTEVTLAASATYSEEIRIDLSSSDFHADYVFSPAGDDVRVFESDDTTVVDFYVTGWDSVNRSATIYVRPGTLTAGSSTNYFIYYGDADAVSTSDVASVFPGSGVRLRSRVSTVDPADAASGRAAFAGATTDVYNDIRSSVTGLNNQSLGGSNGNFGWCVSALVEVTSATAGLWEFRYGGDFGRGGHLYVAETELEAQWNDDLWWAGNFSNVNETLEGSISLAEGWHRYEALGFEGCCDGGVGFQAREPGGSWQDLNTANFSLRGAQCVAPPIVITASAPETCSKELAAEKSMDVISDSIGSADPYALPGSQVEYELTIMNTGQSVDSGSIELVDFLPPNVKLVVSGPSAFEMLDGATPSSLTMNWGGPSSSTDDIDFSIDGNFTGYAPVLDGAGADAAVTHIRFRPQGEFSAYSDAGGTPTFTIRFRAIVE